MRKKKRKYCFGSCRFCMGKRFKDHTSACRGASTDVFIWRSGPPLLCLFDGPYQGSTKLQKEKQDTLRQWYVHLYTVHINLTGSQHRKANTGWMFSLFLVLVSTRIAFWIKGRDFNDFFRQPHKTELQWSSLEEIKAWINVSALLWDRTFWTLAMLHMWQTPAPETCLIWVSTNKSWKNKTSRFQF